MSDKSMAFVGCSKLENITIPDSVSSIGQLAFSECRSLRHITIPNSVTYIGMSAFDRCSGLTELTIPASLTSIGVAAFGNCSSLTSVTIPDSITSIAQDDPFIRCTSLSALRIMVSGSNEVRVNSKNVFSRCPEERYISFLTTDGTAELTGSAYEAARDVYKSDSRDGSATDNKWYGWSFSSQTGTDTTYKVTIKVRKDNQDWPNHGMTFALLANGGSEFLYDLDHVPDGTYRIYDVTGVRRDSLWSKAADTGGSVRVDGADTEVDVTVDGKDEEATVDYYTVTFYDEDEDHSYGANTDQKPQVVLKGKAVLKPSDPGKANHVFTGWVTAEGG